MRRGRPNEATAVPGSRAAPPTLAAEAARTYCAPGYGRSRRRLQGEIPVRERRHSYDVAEIRNTSGARDRTPGAPEKETGTDLRERPESRLPRLYRVLLHNDDYTTMEFVVEVLVRFFHLSETEAGRIMLQVHYDGAGVAGTFTRDVAETKVEQVTTLAREEGFPLLLTMEPE